MSFFGWFKKKERPSSPVTIKTTTSWHYAGEGDCPEPQFIAPVEIPSHTSKLAIGYYNLAVFSASGYILNPKTGRKNKKYIKKIYVMDESEAWNIANNSGFIEIIEVSQDRSMDEPPNEYQVANAKGRGIEIPSDATDSDVRWMVSDGHSLRPTPALAIFCTERRLFFCLFISERTLIHQLYDDMTELERIGFFAYAVDCAVNNCRLGDPFANPKYMNFAHNATPDVISLIEARGLSDFPVPRKGTKAYTAVITGLNNII